MKIFAFLSILAIVLLCLLFGPVKTESDSGAGIEPACDTLPVRGCPKIYDPVCGSNKITYDNECTLCSENRAKKINIRISRKGPC